tara:strand:- start:176 stop:352 length:177 start_codon:yes stop_codon:yes gene_type:complete
MKDPIENLQERCFAMLGTINVLNHAESQTDELTAKFNKDLTELMKAGSQFFAPPPEKQ